MNTISAWRHTNDDDDDGNDHDHGDEDDHLVWH